jgi:hypothetical protein
MNYDIKCVIGAIKDDLNNLIKLSDKYQEVIDVNLGYGLILHYTPPKKISKTEALRVLESGKILTEEEKKLIADAIRNADIEDDWENSWNSSNC